MAEVSLDKCLEAAMEVARQAGKVRMFLLCLGHAGFTQGYQPLLTRNPKNCEENPAYCIGLMGIDWLKIQTSLIAYYAN